MSDIKFKVINKLDHDLLSQWHTLWQDCGQAHFFNSPMWFLSCLRAFTIKEFYIFCQYKEDKLEIILPLIKSHKYGINVLCSPGKKYLDKTTLLFIGCDYSDLHNFFEQVLKYGNLYLTEIDKNLRHNLQNKYLFYKSSDNPYIDLAGQLSWLNKKHRSEIKNRIKKVGDHLDFQLHFSDTDKYLKDIFGIEDRSYKKQKGRHIFSDIQARKLYENIAKMKGDNSAVVLLYFDNSPIAHLFGLTYKNIFLAYHMAYLSNYRNIMPGKILLYHLIIKLQALEYKLFDFSRGQSSLKSQFTGTTREQYDLLTSNSFFVVFYWRLMLLINWVISKLRRFVKRLLIKVNYVKI